MSSLAILFADVVGSTSLYQRHGDDAALRGIESALAVMREVTCANRGRVVKTIGDELMVVFGAADDAFRAACEMQWQLGDLPPLGSEQIGVRIGFHYGPAIDHDSDVFGDSVNLAARLVGLAKGGQIITSGRTLETIDPQLARHTRRIDRVALKGMSEEETIFEALWDESEEITTMLSTTAALMPRPPTRLRLRYEGAEIVMEPVRRSLTLGRDAANDVMIVTRHASRVHARIEWRRDKFVLIDQSTNGTYVQGEGGNEVLLRIEELALSGRGRISFGQPIAKATDGLVEFNCEGGAAAPAPARDELATTG